MRIIYISLVFVLLMALSSIAEGLEITEIDFNVDYDEAYTYRIENKERINSGSVAIANNSKIGADILPGSNLTFTIRVENTFQGDDPELRGIVVEITIEDIDDGADLSEESSDFDLAPGDDARVDVKFAIPLNVEEGTYNVILKAEGEDKNETDYRTELILELEVHKQSHDIRITKVLLNPSILDCNRKASLAAEITNVGSNPENELALEFKSSALGINSVDRDISLESSDEATDEEKMYIKTLNIEVPSFFKSGTYPVLINLYWKNFVLFDQKTVDLVVRDCSQFEEFIEESEIIQKEPEPSTLNNDLDKSEENITIGEVSKEEAKENIIVATEEISIFNVPSIMFMMFGAINASIIIVLVIVVYFRTKIKKVQ